MATLMTLAGCHSLFPEHAEDCPASANEETSVAQGPVGRINFPLDHPRKIRPAEFPSAESNRLLGYLAQEVEPWRNITVSAYTQHGLFIGLDNGEWGGKLLYVPREAKFPNPPIIPQNVTFAFENGDRLFVLTGLSHMGISRGALWSVVLGKAPIAQKLIEFPAEVNSIISTPKRSLVFVTERGNYGLPWGGQIAPCR